MKARLPTPVFNTPHLNSIFTFPLPLDEQKLLRPVETVLFPGSLVEIVRMCSDNVLEIRTEEYPGSSLYTDLRFLEPATDGLQRVKKCPPLKTILEKLKSWPQTDYIWGGNFYRGIPELLEWYPIPKEADAMTRNIWMLKGVDCSGLLYEVTEGILPRNTSQLISFGHPVKVEGKSDEEIAQCLLPGDLIAWRGHVLFVEEDTIFESRIGAGTIRTETKQRLREIREKMGRLPVNDPAHSSQKTIYVVRRWHEELKGCADQR